MIIRSKAPLRLGLAGGGSDVSPYSDLYGRSILTRRSIFMLIVRSKRRRTAKSRLLQPTSGRRQFSKSLPVLPVDGTLNLHKGVYNRIVKDFRVPAPSCRITTYSDAPPGSGLGSSSTMVVAIVKAFVRVAQSTPGRL